MVYSGRLKKVLRNDGTLRQPTILRKKTDTFTKGIKLRRKEDGGSDRDARSSNSETARTILDLSLPTSPSDLRTLEILSEAATWIMHMMVPEFLPRGILLCVDSARAMTECRDCSHSSGEID